MSDALLAAALDAHRRGQCDIAAQRYEALTTDPTVPVSLRTDAYYWRGVLALQQCNTVPARDDAPHETGPDIALIADALRAFDAALALYPAHPAAQLNRGHAFRQSGKREAARAAYSSAIALCGIRLRAAGLSDDNSGTAPATVAQSDLSPDASPAPRSAAREPQLAAAALSALGSLQAEEAAGESESGVPSLASSIAAGTAASTSRHAPRSASTTTSPDKGSLLANALACFDAALQCFDAHPATHDQRGLVLAALGRYADAETAHRRALALQPGHPGYANNLGIALKAQGQLDDAAAAFRDALRGMPDFVPALINLGQTVALQGEHDQATAPLLRAAQLAPDLDLVQCELAQAFHAQGKEAAALQHAERAVEIAPDGPTGWQNLGVARFETGDAAGAAKAFDRVIALTPVPARAAAAALPVAPFAENGSAAPTHLADPILRLAPIYALARFSRACLLLSDGGSPAGWRQFEARLALGDGNRRALAPIRTNGSPLPRWLGEPAGQHRMPLPPRPAAQSGRPMIAKYGATDESPYDTTDEATYLRLPGRTLLVLAEQGYGDTMQFLRFIGCLTARGANVVLALQPALCALMRGNTALADSARGRRLTVITQGVDPLPSGIDAYCHIGSIPACLRIGKLPRPGDAGTWTTPYLFASADVADVTDEAPLPPTVHAAAPPKRPAGVTTRGAPAVAAPRIVKLGFAWSGRRPGATAARQRTARDAARATGVTDSAPIEACAASDEDFDNAVVRFDKRAIPLDELAPLLNLAHTEWHPLQTDIRGDEYALLDALSAQARIVLPTRPARDFATTARRIAALDHVVTIDTSIAHLAGAMGKPTTLLLSHVADWRWTGSLGNARTEGVDVSLWYPSIRIIRQPRNGDWTSVIARAAALLDPTP
ncbi:tetratricopeptide repeat protein [Robbsia sp. KACC 23696]|uniref:tetratricopeptide repeat protein n=1 Tax=Robbsia sp. KACC 23696 TaxID=3149231 RepID=UPI00325AF225